MQVPPYISADFSTKMTSLPAFSKGLSQSFPCFTKTDDEMLSVADIVRMCHNLPLNIYP